LWITFYYQSKRYRRALNLEDTRSNKKLAQNKLIPEIQYKVNTGEFFENEKEKIPTVDEFAYTSFEIHKNNRKKITQDRYVRLYEKHIKPFFGKKRLDHIKPSALAKWQNTLSEYLAGKSIKGVRTIFNTIFDDALKDDIINKNPFSHIRAPKQEDVIEKLPFNMEEIMTILNNCHDNIRAFLAIGFFTGMRTGEIIGLKWSDVKFDDMIIEVRRARRQGIESKPKTINSIRDVEILDILLPYLMEHKNLGISNEYIFETYTGLPFNTCDKISSHYWRPLLKELDIKYRNLYQMRHTFASLMISNGEDILWVSHMLGHKDSSTTLEKYARYIKHKNKKRAQFLNKYC
jgi:integrase